MFEDNVACVMAASTDKPMQPRSKHINTRIFKLKEFVQEGILELKKVNSANNVADCLTKSLSREGVEAA